MIILSFLLALYTKAIILLAKKMTELASMWNSFKIQNLKFHYDYIKRFLSDANIRKTNQNSAQNKYSEAELIDIQNELDDKIRSTAPNRVINADEMGMLRGSWTASTGQLLFVSVSLDRPHFLTIQRFNSQF